MSAWTNQLVLTRNHQKSGRWSPAIWSEFVCNPTWRSNSTIGAGSRTIYPDAPRPSAAWSSWGSRRKGNDRLSPHGSLPVLYVDSFNVRDSSTHDYGGNRYK